MLLALCRGFLLCLGSNYVLHGAKHHSRLLLRCCFYVQSHGTIDSTSPDGDCRSGRNCLERALFDKGHRRLPEPSDNSVICIFLLCFYLSARIGLFRKSSYAAFIPSSSSVLYLQPRAALLETSSSLRGVPLGFDVSHNISPW